MRNFPDATITYSTNKLEDIENKIEKMKLEHEKLNRNCEIEIVPKPNPKTIIFDENTNIPFQLSIYIRHLSTN
ncbi:hypothetical protein Ccar_04700 [Clostridium carboxidivorans P7]|uniref:Uncharacterized protein n=1 Tax=Clostridium carboxidivorans P7 TaxID=536227 RepID=C6PVT2_9CLOT|nr:hypothetical protein [Clostridium carboxidivorans]AKN30158.1 hypothetical protein Ccar_04700 [Clostridium carboxidivorans P7]EET86629.1 conserved hypothetical protein [Clostridium carboxidivorans P7]